MSDRKKAYGLLFVLFLAAYAFVVLDSVGGVLSVNGRSAWGRHHLSSASGGSVSGRVLPDGGWESQIGDFHRERGKHGYRVIYGWTDYFDSTRTLALDISDLDLGIAETSFGITSESRQEYYEALFPLHLQKHPELEDIIRTIQQRKGPVHLRDYRIVSPGTYDRFRDVCMHFERDYLKARGFHISRGCRVIDYSAVVRKHTVLMKDVAVELVAMARNSNFNLKGLLYIVMSFVQYIQYEIPPIEVEGRYLLGLWSPTEALVRGTGDCDTKAVLFSSIANNYNDVQTLIVVIPGHAFNGIVGWHKRLPKDYVIKHRGQDVLLLDLTSTSTFRYGGAIHEKDKQNLRNRFPIVYETH